MITMGSDNEREQGSLNAERVRTANRAVLKVKPKQEGFLGPKKVRSGGVGQANSESLSFIVGNQLPRAFHRILGRSLH